MMTEFKRGPGRPRKIPVEVQDIPVQSQDLVLEERERKPAERAPRLWPADVPFPTHFLRPHPVPCPQCRRMRMDDGGQAVATHHVTEAMAYFRCKCCQHGFKMPIKRV